MENESHFSTLRGTFSQYHRRFPLLSRGKQCTAIAAAAAAYSSYKSPDSWTRADMDALLVDGNNFYLRCLRKLENPPHYLATDELLETVTVAGVQFRLHTKVDLVVGLLNGRHPEDVPVGFFKNMETALQHFFESKSSGIITSQTLISIAVCKFEDLFYLVDSHPCGSHGFPARRRGKSSVMKFASLPSLSKHIVCSLRATKRLKDVQFSITAVDGEIVEQDTGEQTKLYNVEMEVDGVEQDTGEQTKLYTVEMEVEEYSYIN